jgi:hypothetical protein
LYGIEVARIEASNFLILTPHYFKGDTEIAGSYLVIENRFYNDLKNKNFEALDGYSFKDVRDRDAYGDYTKYGTINTVTFQYLEGGLNITSSIEQINTNKISTLTYFSCK